MQKCTWYSQTFEEHGEIKNSHATCLVTYMFRGPLFNIEDMKNKKQKNKLQVPQQNEMLSLYCTVPDFITKNEEYKLKNNI